MVIEFIKIQGSRSGKLMAEIFIRTIGPDYEIVKEKVRDGKKTITTTKHISLDCRAKLFAMCGDNTGPNGTFAEYSYIILLEDHDDSLTPAAGLPRCRFHGRDSQIRCAAHIIALIAGAIYKELRGGEFREAAQFLERVHDAGGVFNPQECLALSVYEKIRAIVLWITETEERRLAWSKLSPILIPLDVSTRWNALYLMMSKAYQHREAIQRLARMFPQLHPLVPTDREWEVAATLEKVLQPLYNFTVSVSRAQLCLPDILGLMWGLDDLLDDVSNA